MKTNIFTIITFMLCFSLAVQAQLTSIFIDSVEYEYFNFPIVYDKVDEFEGTRIMHTSRIDWARSETGNYASIWVSRVDSIYILNILSGFEACIDDRNNLRIKLTTGEFIELISLNDINCTRLKIKKFMLDDDSINSIIKSSVEIARISTSEGNVDYRPIFNRDILEFELGYHQNKLSVSNLTNRDKRYHKEQIEIIKKSFNGGYKGNPYFLVHIDASNFEGTTCTSSYKDYQKKKEDLSKYSYELSLFDKYDVTSCRELAKFYNENVDVLASLILSIQAIQP